MSLRTRKQPLPRRELSIDFGRFHAGAVIVIGEGNTATYEARDAAGALLGTFPRQRPAVDLVVATAWPTMQEIARHGR
jgi:hypothetical protein